MPRLFSILPPLMLSASLLAIAGCNSTAKDQQPVELARVRTSPAVTGPAAPSIRTNGLLANEDEIRLSFKVGGVIRRLSVSEGDQVRKGQKLAEIEQAEIDAEVEQASQAYEKARRDLERGERLYADKVISLEQLQDLRTQLAVNEAALNSAKFNWSYATIVAPHDGTILRRLAEERELVQAGNPILVLGAKDKGFVVRTGLADREIVQVKLGDEAQIRLDALPGKILTGKVTEVSGAADSGSGMFGIEVSLDPTDLPLKSGLVAKLTITPSTAKSGERVYVPIGAIVEGDGRTARVFVLDQKHARRREVQVAFIEGEAVALNEGLQAGEHVVTDGAQYLEDGEEVTLVDAPVAANRE
ncbi:efflux RND transporter periplasmic adaptor subunit [Steroidobacter sp. S1-65]|uniref:Efflux RND transporter periplasmic adaptor subunit n=1 Tax=Steroidobacter gossypii TaxID=2805490 RepID=A0ABS1WTQ9_9GAMM|nr:efflux RND transporter periplasmic adaptor subunit [Steroidobacter gossypii]MBM0104360.1 efflux RND transporter periplasmic adaptor subunit [Steroidobacter gossypii]